MTGSGTWRAKDIWKRFLHGHLDVLLNSYFEIFWRDFEIGNYEDNAKVGKRHACRLPIQVKLTE